jgi:hypothetical protein
VSPQIPYFKGSFLLIFLLFLWPLSLQKHSQGNGLSSALGKCGWEMPGPQVPAEPSGVHVPGSLVPPLSTGPRACCSHQNRQAGAAWQIAWRGGLRGWEAHDTWTRMFTWAVVSTPFFLFLPCPAPLTIYPPCLCFPWGLQSPWPAGVSEMLTPRSHSPVPGTHALGCQ